MKRNRAERRQGPKPTRAPGEPAAAAADFVAHEIRDSNRTGFQFLGAAAVCMLLAAAFFATGYRIGVDIAAVGGWFCGAFALAWLITATAHRIPLFARWTLRASTLPARFRPSSALAAVLWFFIFHGGGIVIIRTFGL